ncbi:MAG: phage terminase large subunit family protein [Desulfotalea sp.]
MLTAPNAPRQYKAKSYPWMPESLKEGFTYTTSFSKAERRVLRKQKFQKPSEWVPNNRKLTKGDLAGSYLSFEITPHLRGILDAAALPFVRELIFQAAPQTAKTTGIDSYVAWSRIFDRGPACSFYPDEVTANRAMDERIEPLVTSSASLKRLMLKGRNNSTKTSLRMIGGNWEVGWAGSTAQTADRPLKIVDMQEVNKPSYGKSKDETGAVFLLRQRVRSYKGHKIFMSSTPTTEDGNITVLLENECEAVFVQWVHCPHCHEEIFMYFSEDTFYPLVPDRDDEGNVTEPLDRLRIKSQKMGRYICQECGSLWDDNDRNKAIRRETWRLRLLDEDGDIKSDEKGEEMFRYLLRVRPASIGWIEPSWMSYMVSLSEVVHDALRCHDEKLPENERKKAKKDFANSHEAQPWKVEVTLRKSDELEKLKDNRPESVVPGGNRVVGLVAGIDTQDDGVWFWIHARGAGLNPQRWLIACGFLQDFDAEKSVIMDAEYKDADGNIYPVRQAVQDAMGHRTSEVYDFCATTYGLILPAKGEQRMATPYATAPVEFYPGTEKKKFPWALKRVRVDSNYYKDKADGILKTGRDFPGGMAFHSEMANGHINQLCAEVIGEDSGVWENPKSRHNHLWDCFYMALCAEDILRMKDWPAPGDELDDDEDDSFVSEVVIASVG